jgi:3-isopropylmalate/(R)-2-methylmalate dehydratase small subunit
VAPSFADIFFNNCFKNGILPIVLPKEQVELLMAEAARAPGPTFTVDLDTKEITRPMGNAPIPFEVDGHARHCLLNGLDDIGLTLEKAAAIDAYEAGLRRARPWLFRAAA